MSKYVTGTRGNNRGAQRTSVTEPDEIAVERFTAGDHGLVLATVDRDAAIDYLDARGFSAAQIAARLGMCNKTIHRRRAARRGAL